VVLQVTFLIALAACIQAQPTFDAASVKPANPAARGASLEILPGGNLAATNVSLRALLKEAYGIRDFQIASAPSWIDSERFDIQARSSDAGGDKQVRLMLQSLLADRFKLLAHRESRDLQAYVLTVAKNGSKLTAAAQHPEGASGVRIRGSGRLTGTQATTGQLAQALSDIHLNGSTILDRPVLDLTGLSGTYDFTLEWTPDLAASDSTDRSGPSIFTAVQEQLGLKLEKQKAPVDIFVIDHVEKPAEN
jgi:uncharacterized protein (TIGR03435 family)